MAPGFPGFGHRSSTQGDEALSSASALSFASIGWMLLGPQELLTPKNANEMRWDEMNYLNYQQRTGSGVKLWRTGLSIENRDFANQNCFFWNRGFDQQAGLTKIKNLTSIVAGLENLNLPQNAKPNWMILDGFNSLDPSHGLSSHGGYPRPDAALLSLGEVIREPMMVVVTRAFVLKVFLYSKTIDLG